MLIALQDLVSSSSPVSNPTLSATPSSNPNLTAGLVTTLDWLQRDKRFGSNAVADDGNITEKVYVYVCVYACMYACMYVCIYVQYVCMYIIYLCLHEM